MSDPSSPRTSNDWLDAALAAWPNAPRPEAELEASAEAVMARIAKGERGTSLASIDDGNIFGSPVGQTPEESHNTAASVAANSTTSAAPASSRARGKSEESMSMSSDRERDRRSLQDLAKLAQSSPPSSIKFDVGPLSSPSSSRAGEDSGLVDFSALAGPPSKPEPAVAAPAPSAPPSAVAAPASVPAPASAKAPLSAPPAVISEAPSTDAPLSGPSVAAAAAPSTPAPAPAVMAVASKPEENKGNGKVIAIGALFAAAAIAAGAFFAMKKPAEAPTAMATPPAAEAPKAETKPAEAPKAETKPEDTKVETAAPANGAPKTVVAAKAGAAVAKVDTSKDKPEAKEDKKVEAKDLPASAGGTNDLGAAMRQAAGPGAGSGESGDKPSGPQFAAGSVPQKPSQGAITGALGAVLGGARACVGPDDPISRATVTFASAGNVTSVSVSGGAVGKPAEGCIKAALSKAKVAPFAEASYSAPVTIRH